MKGYCTFCFLLLLLSLSLLPLHLVSGRHITKTTRPHHGGHHGNKKVEEAATSYYYRTEMRRRGAAGRGRGGPETVEIAGSRLPDCSHACGSCYPCRLVMVSFVCASLEEAETCPMAYKCMCRNKSYPVP
ncbi:unnamed protein product [Linum tenue]|uniref:Epidermal patterning factor-like protein n=2 Tax=Linum tenue TaxID=586396 RepID=A0AAV0NQZ2_9ROSI|nr:unnamed protein product [Linum tenue]